MRFVGRIGVLAPVHIELRRLNLIDSAIAETKAGWEAEALMASEDDHCLQGEWICMYFVDEFEEGVVESCEGERSD